MTAQVVQCADAVVSLINAASLSASVWAIRKNRPITRLEDLDSLACTVVPRVRVTEPSNRSDDQVTITIDIGLQRLFVADDESNEDSDSLIGLAEEVQELLARSRLTGDDGVSVFTCVRTVCGDGDSPFFSVDQGNELQLSTAVVSATFMAWRAVA